MGGAEPSRGGGTREKEREERLVMRERERLRLGWLDWVVCEGDDNETRKRGPCTAQHKVGLEVYCIAVYCDFYLFVFSFYLGNFEVVLITGYLSGGVIFGARNSHQRRI